MTERKKANESKFRLSEGLLLAIAPAYAYLLAYYYESGYAKHFNIPTQFISVSLVNVLIFVGVLIGFGFVLLYLLNSFNLIYLVFPKNINPNIKANILALLPIELFIAFFIYLFGLQAWTQWIWLLLFGIFYATILFLLPIVTQRDTKGYLAKLDAQRELDNRVTGVYDVLRHRYGRHTITLILLMLLGTVLAENAGRAAATRQTDFLVTDTSPELVVLRMYGDKMILASFDRTSGTVESQFRIFKMAEDNGLVLNYEEIGPLHQDQPTHPPTPQVVPTSTPTPSPTKSPTKMTGTPYP